jgi:aspartate aminotransferase
MPASPIRKLVRFADEAKDRGIHVYHLNIGQPDIPTPQQFLQAVCGFTGNVLSYGPSEGLKELRMVLVDYLEKQGISLDVGDIMVTTGGSEAIVFTMMAICDVGDEVIIPEPFYTNYNGFAQMAAIKVVPITTYVDDGFHLPPQEMLEQKVTPRTRAILIGSPNNPTGTIYTRIEMERVAQFAQKHGLFIISDEVYREFTFDGRHHTSVLDLPEVAEQAVLVDSISKRFSACGARIGFIASRNRDLIDSVVKFGQARLCPPTIEQLGAIAGFQSIDQFMTDMVATYERRRDVVYDDLVSMLGGTVHRPEGAFYTVVPLPVDNAEDFTRWMLTEFHVDGKTTMVAPAAGFYATPGKGLNEVRIAYVLKEPDLHDAMQILARGIDAYNA